MQLTKHKSPGTYDFMYSGNDFTMKREYGKSPNGSLFRGRWVLRNANDNVIDFDEYRNDIAERNNIELIG